MASGDHEGNAFFWKDLEGSIETINYGSIIEDVKTVDGNLIAIVGENGYLSFWDLRTNSIVQSSDVSDKYKREVYTVSINPVQNQLLLTGGQDTTVKIWDRRNLSAKLHKFEGHEDNVLSVEWSPVNSIDLTI